MIAPAVEISGLVMRYGDTVAVDGLDLTVDSGTITSILGPNGAGKTTTVETCEGYRVPHDGTVRVLGERPGSAALRPRVGVMLQGGGAWLGVRAREMLTYVAQLHAHPLDVDTLIERLGLGSCSGTPWRRLSGGQQQRLSLAMAVVGRPELVFLDEPTAGLDPQARRATWELLRELRDCGATAVLTTHFMDEAEALSDRIHILNAGKVIASGAPNELTADGAGSTIRFDARAGLDTGQLAAKLGMLVDEVSSGSYLVSGDVTPDVVASLTAWFAAEGILAERVLVERQSLEDRFLELTGRTLS